VGTYLQAVLLQQRLQPGVVGVHRDEAGRRATPVGGRQVSQAQGHSYAQLCGMSLLISLTRPRKQLVCVDAVFLRPEGLCKHCSDAGVVTSGSCCSRRTACWAVIVVTSERIAHGRRAW
jgi:hypothetical protein